MSFLSTGVEGLVEAVVGEISTGTVPEDERPSGIDVLLGLMEKNQCTRFWATQNYKVRNWDGTTDWCRICLPLRGPIKPGVAYVRFTDGEMQQMDAKHFCHSVEVFV